MKIDLNLKNVFYIGCMTSLRYAIPFIKSTKKLLDVDVVLAYDSEMKNEKYNNINLNLKRLLEIVKENDISIIDISNVNLKTQVLICVENVVCNVKYDKIFSVQHGFDYYINLLKLEKNIVYLVQDSHHQAVLQDVGIESLIQPFPIIFWDWDYYVKYIDENFSFKKSALIFYPEFNLEKQARQVYEFLKNENYDIYVKQRAKHQRVPEDLQKIIYDNVWYPAEAVFLSMMSDVVVGFGTSAYTDLIKLNRKFFDFCLTEESKKYWKPQQTNFFVLPENFDKSFPIFTESICNNNVNLDKRFQNYSNFQILNFLNNIIAK